jgi:YggT family protein
MQILLFLLDTFFFFLIGAALLRAWMNTRRLRMTQQPGIFVMAVTDWIVQPLRRTLPRAWAQANADWGSFCAALILALAYAALWHLLSGGQVAGVEGLGVVFAIVLLAVMFMLRTVLMGLMLLALAYAVLSWVQPYAPMQATLSRLIEPVLAPIRRIIPQIGGVDLSVLILIIVLQVGLIVIA